MVKNKKAFSYVEILVTLAILALLGATIPLTLNFKKQLDRSNDVKRKNELTTLKNALEEYYTSEKGYPSASEMCFNMPAPVRYVDSLGLNMGCVCNICGKKTAGDSSSSDSFRQLIKDVPCDPASSALLSQVDQDYIYNYDCSSGAIRPQWFRIYAKLANPTDLAATELGCKTGCGPKHIINGRDIIDNTNSAQTTNNFGVSSPNIELEK